MNRYVLAAAGAGLSLLGALCADGARADVFNGRISFSSFRVEPPAGQPRTGDIFSMNPDGTDQRQLTDNPADDAQSDWAPDGLDIAYRIRKPGFTINFEVARMTASGQDHRRLTFTPDLQASSQPAWFSDKSAILFRRSGPGPVSSIWQMGPLGESPALRYDPDGAQFYPSLSPDMRKVLFITTTTSPTGDTDRAIQTLNVDGSGVETLFDVVGASDTAPAWSPDGTMIAFESNASGDGNNPEGDKEIWVMSADGTNSTQLTHNALHDEGPAWSPDGALLAYSSGIDNDHLDINVMTAAGVHLRQITDYPGRDESPDWQPIPAPETDRRCGDLAASGPGVHDVRAAGLSCRHARELAARWAVTARSCTVDEFIADVADYGGTLRVVLQRHRSDDDDHKPDDDSGAQHLRDGRHDKLIAFLYQPPMRAVSFAAASNVATGDGPIALTASDFNHDGNKDLAVANLNGREVTVLLGRGAGSFGSAASLAVGAEPHSVAAGDFNEDGRKDLVVANAADDNLSVLLGKRRGSFRPATSFPTGDTPAWVAIGDFNDDADHDVAVSNFGSNDVSVLLGTGSGGFAAPIAFPAGAAPRAIVTGDFNDDGAEDLAVANQSSNDVSVLLGTGTGSFRSATGLPVGLAPSAIAADDLNEDCKDDLVTADLRSRNASVLLGTGTGSFRPAVNFPAGAGPRSVAIGDVNDDANNDLIVANNDDGTVSVLAGTGTGNFHAAGTFPVGLGPRSIVVADLNEDGKNDLAVANRDSDNVSVLLNTTM